MEEQKVEVTLALMNSIMAYLGRQEPVQLVAAIQSQVSPQLSPPVEAPKSE